jgi:glycosyltransferase involved in cell wall biosynthesis
VTIPGTSALPGHLIKNQGSMPASPLDHPSDRFELAILEDLRAADHVVVNSQFAKHTLIHQRILPDDITVIYLGVDDRFLEGSTADPTAPTKHGPLRVAFAGSVEAKKGAPTLLEALRRLDDIPWVLDLVGKVHSDVLRAHRDVLDDPRVRVRGVLSRKELRQVLEASEIFVLPSLAEGSARVIFEALACGCFVITTSNSGSIVRPGVHGELVAPGDADSLRGLRGAIQRSFVDRERVAAVGSRNRHIIRNKYRQAQYGVALRSLYRELQARISGADT